MTDTIFAPATAAGRAAVAVVRLSGPRSGEVLRALAGRLPAPRRATLRTLRHAGEEIDRALVLWMPGPDSYTGEDSAEFHVHGGRAVLLALSEALAAAGARSAEPGEFTRRAFEVGKLDLAQAEAVADLVDADTAAQRRQALLQLDGALGAAHAAWRDLLVEALAMLEAAIDFPDEELPADVAERTRPPLRRLAAGLGTAIADAGRGRQVREGFRIALIGAPNAGKSTWLNALAGRDAAIVTDIPGTTRDVIEVPVEWAGYKVLLADTAGVRDTGDPVEAEGVRRAAAWAASADLRLWISDLSAAPAGEDAAERLVRAGDLRLLNKSDLGAPIPAPGPSEVRSRVTSARDPAEVDEVRALLTEQIVASAAGAFPAGTRGRHVEALQAALSHVERALAELEPELAAEDVRLAVRALDSIAGRIGADEVLGRVFATFCIGK
ncbi:MAG: tRNA uridine-5-carboxymethylaminomethyl(34) synthesis GTPase MnmE [Caulobacteraceae bacterium]|nr:tRNA uridine-5-carboxymethylaminomethyl(34) synthesis GTPase MnmE [Caulobacteraceae bacterium]